MHEHAPIYFPQITHFNKYLDKLEVKIKNNRVDMKSLVAKKSREVLWMYSNCRVKDRVRYAEQLIKSGMQIDIFGRCGKPDPCKSKFNIECVKTNAAKYWFYLAFENSHCEDYITEKAWNSLTWGTIPIVNGPSIEGYEYYLPPNSFLHVENFSNPSELAKYMKYLQNNTEAYLKYHEWRSSYDIVNDLFYLQVCTMCKNINDPPKTAHKNVSQWWQFARLCKH